MIGGVAIDDRPECSLTGTDGNVYALIGKVSRALQRAGLPDREALFIQASLSAKSYDDVLSLIPDYVDVV